MKTDREIQAEIRAGVSDREDREFAASLGGAKMLDELWNRLQVFQRDYGVYIDKGPRERPKSIEIRRDLKAPPVARWTRDGVKLLFASTAGDVEATSVETAIALTLHHLETNTVLDPTATVRRMGFL